MTARAAGAEWGQGSRQIAGEAQRGHAGPAPRLAAAERSGVPCALCGGSVIAMVKAARYRHGDELALAGQSREGGLLAAGALMVARRVVVVVQTLSEQPLQKPLVQQQQHIPDAARTSQGILPAETADEILHLIRYRRPPRPRAPAPEQAVGSRMPALHRLGLHQMRQFLPALKEPGERDPEETKGGGGVPRCLLRLLGVFSATASWLSAATTRAASMALGSSSAQQTRNS